MVKDTRLMHHVVLKILSLRLVVVVVDSARGRMTGLYIMATEHCSSPPMLVSVDLTLW